MSDLRERVPGHSLIDELLRHRDRGSFRAGTEPGTVVIDDEAMSWYRGVIGERHVAALLDELGDGWTILHSVPTGEYGDIDHVAIGEAGVFTINTKYSPGASVWAAGRTLMVGPRSVPYVSSSLREGRRASELLSRASGMTVPVVSLLVFVEPERISYRRPHQPAPGDPEFFILSDRQIPHTLRGPSVFTAEQTARIATAARRPETWGPTPSVSTDPRVVLREFLSLEALVGDGWRPGSKASMSAGGASRETDAPPPVSAEADLVPHGRPRCGRSRADVIVRDVLLPAAILGAFWMWVTSL
ncbi:nuclease-related domain-containing protein [Microbacterium sp. UBA1612]|mgnify:CR=1 FL=1|uniref:nuclease-related domain-containing protein n=1 Tax=Microbacterium sp. UBA1612 TaxID=1946942 RepID=UPI00257B4BDB|nr:nuclease-related domain-containing protein [Microbacterium sp. UBA1612]